MIVIMCLVRFILISSLLVVDLLRCDVTDGYLRRDSATEGEKSLFYETRRRHLSHDPHFTVSSRLTPSYARSSDVISSSAHDTMSSDKLIIVSSPRELDESRRRVFLPHSSHVCKNCSSYTRVKPCRTCSQTHAGLIPEASDSDIPTDDVKMIDRSTKPPQEMAATKGASIIYLGGLFEYSASDRSSESPGGHSEIPHHNSALLSSGDDLKAALLAADHVNSRHVIPGYHLKIVHYNTMCDPGRGANVFYDMIYRKPPVSLLIGTTCSEVAKILGEIVPHWNLLLLSHGAISPALSDREKYPTFYRLMPTDPSHNAARVAFIRHNRWGTVSILHENSEIYALAINALGQSLEKANISVKTSLTFHQATSEELKARLEELKEKDARIIVGSFSQAAAKHVFCQAYLAGVHSPRYVWLLTGTYPTTWWSRDLPEDCTTESLVVALNGSFSVDSTGGPGLSSASPILPSMDEFRRDMSDIYNVSEVGTPAIMAYDTVWTASLLLNQTVRGSAPPHPGRGADSRQLKMIKDAADSLEFTGLSGPIAFDGANRLGITVLKQHTGEEHSAVVAVMYPDNSTLDFDCVGCRPITWLASGRVPADQYTIVPSQRTVSVRVTLVVSVVSVAGLVFAAVCLVFNVNYRRRKLIKMSSPQLNNLAVVGCVFIYAAVVSLAINRPHDAHFFPPVCTLRAWLFSVGFSMSFGSMFLKTFRVFKLFRKAHRGLIKSKFLRDKQLLLMVGGLVLLDTLLVVLWISVDPMHRSILHLPLQPSPTNPDVLIAAEIATCSSVYQHYWTGALYVYKGLMLLFGVYMAWQTRNVQVAALNDSQYIGMNIYNVVLCSVTAVSLSTLLTDDPSLSYTVLASLVLLSTTTMLIVLFVPKMYALSKKDQSTLITAPGFVTKASTRRFGNPEFDRIDTRRRAQIQNRVYKQRLLDLERDLARLERLLALPMLPIFGPSLFDTDVNRAYRNVCHRRRSELPKSKDSAASEPEERRESEILDKRLCGQYLGNLPLPYNDDDDDDDSDYEEEIDIRDGVIHTRPVVKRSEKKRQRKPTMIEGFLLTQASHMTMMTGTVMMGKGEPRKSVVERTAESTMDTSLPADDCDVTQTNDDVTTSHNIETEDKDLS